MHERASSFCPAGARIRCRLERASRHGLASATLVVHTRPDRSRCRLWKFTPRPLHTRHRRYSEHRQEQRAVRASAGEGSLAPPSLSHKGSTARVHSVAGIMSASSHTSSRPRVSTFRAWHQPWACDDCRPLGLARLCFIAEHRVPVRSLRLIPCTSGKTGGWEPRGVPLAHVLPNVAPHA